MRCPPTSKSELVPFEREGSVDEDLLEDSVGRIRAYLQQQGFWKADVAVRPLQTRGQARHRLLRAEGPGSFASCRKACRSPAISRCRSRKSRPLVVLQPGDAVCRVRISTHGRRPDPPLHHPRLPLGQREVRRDRSGRRRRGLAWSARRSRSSKARAPCSTRSRSPGPRRSRNRRFAACCRCSRGSRSTSRRSAPAATPCSWSISTSGSRPPRSSSRRRCRRIAPASALNVAIREGAQTFVDHLIVVGNRRTSEEVIRREVLLRPGAPLGLRDLLESRRRLSALGLFRRIDIRQVEHGSSIQARRARHRRRSAGDDDRLWRRRWSSPGVLREGVGGQAVGAHRAGAARLLRHRPPQPGRKEPIGQSLHARQRPAEGRAGRSRARTARGFGFSEYRVVGTYREPARRAVERRPDADRRGRAGRAVELQLHAQGRDRGARPPRDPDRPNAALATRSARPGRSTSGSTTEEQAHHRPPLPAGPPVDRSPARSCATRATTWSSRRAGTFLSGEASLASRALGGQVGFLKTYLQGYWFKRLPGPRAVIFATRASVGLADGFPREVAADRRRRQPDRGRPESSSRTCRRASGSSPAATPPSAASRSTPSARRRRSARAAFRAAATAC